MQAVITSYEMIQDTRVHPDLIEYKVRVDDVGYAAPSGLRLMNFWGHTNAVCDLV